MVRVIMIVMRRYTRGMEGTQLLKKEKKDEI